MKLKIKTDLKCVKVKIFFVSIFSFKNTPNLFQFLVLKIHQIVLFAGILENENTYTEFDQSPRHDHGHPLVGFVERRVGRKFGTKIGG